MSRVWSGASGCLRVRIWDGSAWLVRTDVLQPARDEGESRRGEGAGAVVASAARGSWEQRGGLLGEMLWEAYLRGERIALAGGHQGLRVVQMRDVTPRGGVVGE